MSQAEQVVEIIQGELWTDEEGTVHCDFLKCACYDTSGELVKTKLLLDLTDAETDMMCAGRERRMRKQKTAQQARILFERITALQQDTIASGYIYFVAGLDSVKIGYSLNPVERIANLQTGSPVPLKLLCILSGSPKIETLLHHYFKEQRTHREWFRMCPEIEILAQHLAQGEANKQEA